MLTHDEVERIYALIKILKEDTLEFPDIGDKKQYSADSSSSFDSFVLNVSRGSSIKPKKCTYQIRTTQNDILFRIDIDGPAHPNPNGEDVPCPHLHIYKYNGTPYIENWAIPLHDEIPTNTNDLIQVFEDFLKYNKVKSANKLVITSQIDFL